ncbi:MAG: FAD-dependent oxidoreductase [Gammaproteobacteria bacterium]|jgi:glycerol-3-phosphate dehydrogenase|nr:FAD-dependent oxidoreductase [Gammaproteobacteria bacterium]
MPSIIEKDALIIGGGIAGLWMLNRLRTQGYDVLLLEKNKLGSGQTIASQGMIHGGIKYALSGNLNTASEAIADMPEQWENCLAGTGDIDLSDTNILSKHYYMWPQNSLRSRFNAFLGSKALRGKVTKVGENNYPDFFQTHIKGPLYELKDIVLDVPSLLNSLSKKHQSNIKLFNCAKEWNIEKNAEGEFKSLTLKQDDETFIVRAKQIIISSGEGSKDFLKKLIPDEKLPNEMQMQLRPLQMTIVKHKHSDPIHVHCVADQLTATPEVTITSHKCKDGDTAWYLGGELAESGANRTEEEQIKVAKNKIGELFPWCDLSNARWHSFFINRAEALTKNGKRPETASIHQYLNISLCWPSKLTLAPDLGQQIINIFQGKNIPPSNYTNSDLDNLKFPGIATPPWDSMP